jgi:hypothetical protein
MSQKDLKRIQISPEMSASLSAICISPSLVDISKHDIQYIDYLATSEN